MKRFFATLIVLAIAAAACGGSSSDDNGAGADDAGSDSATSDDAGSDDSGTTTDDSSEAADGAAAEPGEGGGGAEQGLVAELGLPECPVGAHLDAEGVVEIDFWHPYTSLTEEAMEDVAAAFNNSQDKINVTVEAQGTYGELLSKYRESINFDSLPAVAIIDGQAFRDTVDSGTVLPAQSCVEADDFSLDNIDEVVRSFYSLDGALYPASMTVSTPVLYYNRTHFEDAGLDPDVPPRTLAEVAEMAAAIQGAGVSSTPVSLLMQGWFVDTWLTGAGVELVNANNGRAGNATEATFNDGPEANEIYTLLRDMNEDGLITAFSNTPGQLSHYLAVAGEEASMVIETSTAATTVSGVLGGTANLSELADAGIEGIDTAAIDDLRLDIDAAPLPGLTEPGKVFISGGAVYMTNSGSEAEMAAAWEFMKFMSLVESQKTIHLKGSYLPISPEVLNDPEVQLVWENDAAGRWLATAHGQFEAIDPAFSGPAVGPFTEQRDIMNTSLEELLLAGGIPTEVLQGASDELTEALEAYADANF
ncbi:MAG: extracellular solute-binding protein [Acidimicrobiales bacterium]